MWTWIFSLWPKTPYSNRRLSCFVFRNSPWFHDHAFMIHVHGLCTLPLTFCRNPCTQIWPWQPQVKAFPPPSRTLSHHPLVVTDLTVAVVLAHQYQSLWKRWLHPRSWLHWSIQTLWGLISNRKSNITCHSATVCRSTWSTSVMPACHAWMFCRITGPWGVGQHALAGSAWDS